MKLKIKNLKSNPFKKQIDGGKLNKEQVEKIKANLDKLGFFGSLPVFKKNGDYFLIFGHHRVQALKEVYGDNFEVEIDIKDYNEDQVIRGMIVENLSQRVGDFKETKENVVLVKKYLSNNLNILKQCRMDSERHSQKINLEYENKPTANDISEWIDGSSGKVIKKLEILDLLSIAENLDEDLQKDVKKKHDASSEERSNGKLGYVQAIMISKIKDKSEQRQLAKSLSKTEEKRVREQGKHLTAYKEIKELEPKVAKEIASGKIDLNKSQKILQDLKNKKLKSSPMPKKEFNILYADPPWRYDFSETDSRRIESNYPTMDLEDIKKLKIPTDKNAVLFLWATAPKLREALDVMKSWGFEYKTHAIWDKLIIGMGYWFRGRHELLLVGTKGKVNPPEESLRFDSIISEKRTKHSKKPEKVYEMIEKMFPNSKYLELFQRDKRKNWVGWGNE